MSYSSVTQTTNLKICYSANTNKQSVDGTTPTQAIGYNTPMSFNERTKILIGDLGISELANSCVSVVGIGGVGSNCVESLARAGVGAFILVDYDIVSESNINRQALAFNMTIGKSKLEVMSAIIKEINPDAKIQCISMQLLPDNIDEFFNKMRAKPSYIVDTADLVTTKVALAMRAESLNIPYIAALGSGNKLDPQMLQFADIYETHTCKMCKAVRKQARKCGLEKMQVIYSPEEPLVIPADSKTRKARANIGTISYYPAIMGQMIASKVIRDIISK